MIALLQNCVPLVVSPVPNAFVIVKQKELDELHVQVGTFVYAQTPMTSGDVVARGGLRNRGLLLRYLVENQIAPAPENDEDSETVQREFSRRMTERLSLLTRFTKD